jgi:NAD(P)H-hydrate epimerase
MVRTPADANPATYDALLAGPGWGEGRQSVLKTLLDSQRPMVIDADGIRAYATLKDHITSSAILTPHLGELQVLLDEKIEMLSPSVFLDRIRAFATNRGVTLVVKSSLTHIVDEKGEIFIIEGGNPSLGVGGSGDILAGIIGALLARGLQNTTAALQGVLIHQRAGQLAHQDLGYYDSEQLI